MKCAKCDGKMWFIRHSGSYPEACIFCEGWTRSIDMVMKERGTTFVKKGDQWEEVALSDIASTPSTKQAPKSVTGTKKTS